MWRGAASWGLAPTDRRRPDRVPAGRDPDAARAGGTSLFVQRCAGANVGGPRWQRERGGASGTRARVGRPEKKTGWPSQMNSKILHLFKLIQTSSN
jgi:hypothetical protein